MNLRKKHSNLFLRRARFIGIVLFGAFVYFYTSRLQAEQILHILREQAQTPEQSQQILQLQPWHIGLAAMTLLVGIAVIVVRVMPVRIFHSLPRSLGLIFCTIFLFCVLTSPDEQSVIQQRMERLNLIGLYDEAAKTGERYENPTAEILKQRIIALENQGCLGEKFFTSPLGRTLPDSTFFLSGQEPDSAARIRLFCMLRRDLPRLAELCATLPSDSLQRAEEEALVLYNHKSANPLLIYQNTAVETNYNDFTALQKTLRKESPLKGKPSKAEANAMREAYGDTYWYYYFYGNL